MREDIKNSLKNWDVSVEPLPWYFAEVEGLEKVIEEVKKLFSEPLSETEKNKARTYIFWLSAKNSEEFKRELNNLWNGRPLD